VECRSARDYRHLTLVYNGLGRVNSVSEALGSARGNRLRKAIGWYRNHDRLHAGDAIAMASDATNAYITARAAGKDVAILCDTWEIADAINQRLHGHKVSTLG
jgi:hypothetical protein